MAVTIIADAAYQDSVKSESMHVIGKIEWCAAYPPIGRKDVIEYFSETKDGFFHDKVPIDRAGTII